MIVPMNAKVMTFKLWLSRQRRRDDPVGDIARDAIADTLEHRRSVSALCARVEEIGSEAAKDAARRVAREWNRYRKHCTDYSI